MDYDTTEETEKVIDESTEEQTDYTDQMPMMSEDTKEITDETNSTQRENEEVITNTTSTPVQHNHFKKL